jgi:uncharacterized protein YecE (DUF72 family)
MELHTDDMLTEFAVKFKTRIKVGHEIWVFFNNDIHGHAFRNAQRLKEIMKA